jgi:hypothetical protein
MSQAASLPGVAFGFADGEGLLVCARSGDARRVNPEMANAIERFM